MFLFNPFEDLTRFEKSLIAEPCYLLLDFKEACPFTQYEGEAGKLKIEKIMRCLICERGNIRLQGVKAADHRQEHQ